MEDIVGIICAGGLGTSLLPLTEDRNKHLLPIYNKQMILYPLHTLLSAGIENIMIVAGRDKNQNAIPGEFMGLLGSTDKNKLEKLLGYDIPQNIKIDYTLQEEAGGIAQALSLTKRFVSTSNCVVILGDNIIEDNIYDAVQNFKSVTCGAHVFLKECLDEKDLYTYIRPNDLEKEPRARFGIADLDSTTNKIKRIIEKPTKQECPSRFALAGLYMYTPDVFDKIKSLKPSWRGELEISEINELYLKEGLLNYSILKGFWADAGNIESLYKAATLIRDKELKKSV